MLALSVPISKMKTGVGKGWCFPKLTADNPIQAFSGAPQQASKTFLNPATPLLQALHRPDQPYQEAAPPLRYPYPSQAPMSRKPQSTSAHRALSSQCGRGKWAGGQAGCMERHGEAGSAHVPTAPLSTLLPTGGPAQASAPSSCPCTHSLVQEDSEQPALPPAAPGPPSQQDPLSLTATLRPWHMPTRHPVSRFKVCPKAQVPVSPTLGAHTVQLQGQT